MILDLTLGLALSAASFAVIMLLVWFIGKILERISGHD